ncbi:hypothetical protein [Vibrio pacinii]|uniref:hypothetical protein n=1 Tax=Vibrio pacinii TaxID=170674 RepID=UPI000570EF95|nr:hypothetical protein [Vibrio pacinii]
MNPENNVIENIVRLQDIEKTSVRKLVILKCFEIGFLSTNDLESKSKKFRWVDSVIEKKTLASLLAKASFEDKEHTNSVWDNDKEVTGLLNEKIELAEEILDCLSNSIESSIENYPFW